MICALCHSREVFLQAKMPDNCNFVRDIYRCQICSALTPDYGIAPSPEIKNQIEFHEKCWQAIDTGALQRELSDLISLVRFLEPHLGVPGPDRLILEIGAGRGGLLRALRDVGYAARGCEPATNLVAIGREHYSLPADILLNIDADTMLSSIEHTYDAVILWHVIEHLSEPQDILRRVSQIISPHGSIIIQVPLLRQSYIFPEHYFFCSHDSLSYIALQIGFDLADVVYDEENLYVTAVFCRDTKLDPPAFLKFNSVPDPLSQILLINDRSRLVYQDVIRKNSIELVAWEKLAKERQTAIEAMEQLINSGQEAVAAQAIMIDQRIIELAAWEKLAKERQAAIEAMEQLINSGQEAVAAQAIMIDQRIIELAAWEKLAKERQTTIEAMEQLINSGQEAIAAQAIMIDKRDLEIRELRRELDRFNTGLCKMTITSSDSV